MLFLAQEIRELDDFSKISYKYVEFDIPRSLQPILAPLNNFGFAFRINDYLFDAWIDTYNGIKVVYSTLYDETTDVFGEILNIADIFNYFDEDDLSEIGGLTW